MTKAKEQEIDLGMFSTKKAIQMLRYEGMYSDEAYELMKSYFDSIIQKLLLMIKKEATTKNDKNLLKEIDNALHAAKRFHKMNYNIIRPDGFENWNKDEQWSFLAGTGRCDFIVAEMVDASSTEPYIDSTTNYMGCNIFELSISNYSKTSIYALELIDDALQTFDVFTSFFREETTIYSYCEYSFMLISLVENVFWLSNTKNKNFAKKRLEDQKKKDELFLFEIKSLIIKHSNSVLPACQEYYRRHKAKENILWFGNRKHYKVAGWEKDAKRDRVKAIKAKYYRMMKSKSKKNEKKN